MIISSARTSLMVQWLRLHASAAMGTGSILVRKLRLCQAAQSKQSKKQIRTVSSHSSGSQKLKLRCFRTVCPQEASGRAPVSPSFWQPRSHTRVPDTPGSPEGNTEGPGTASSEPLLPS